MKTRSTIAVALAGGLACAAMAFAGPALANKGPFTWCPGDGYYNGVDTFLAWDWNVCHTYYTVGYGQGNVPLTYTTDYPASIWDGENPPPALPGCPPIAFLCPPS
ncbi:MAG: hypothetical protein QG671_101 [Actinomycetota bacterium]|nr:hypothetical protein [Actinomycetota bacterium]